MFERLREAGSLAVETEEVAASTMEEPLELEEEELDSESERDRFDMLCLGGSAAELL